MMVSNRHLLFQTLLFRFHVKLQGCIAQIHLWVHPRRGQKHITSMDHVTKGPCGVSTGFFCQNTAGWEWHGLIFVQVSIRHQQKTQTTSRRLVQNLLFLGFLAALKFLTLLLLLSCIRYTWRVASAESFMGNHEGSYSWSLTVEPTIPDLCHYVANARGQCSFCFLKMGVWSRWYWNPEGCYGCYYVIQMPKVSIEHRRCL